MRIKELIFGNYKNEDDYIPNLFVRISNKFSSYLENKKFCSCGLFRYCFWHYICPSESEKTKLKS